MVRNALKVHRVALAGMGTVFPDPRSTGVGGPAPEGSGKGHPRISLLDEAFFEQHIDQQTLRLLDRSVALGLIASMRAIGSCGWSEERPHTEVGCCMGTTFAGTHSLEDFLEVMREKGPKKVHPRALQVTIGNATASNMSIHHSFWGPTVACSGSFLSGMHALIYSADAMALGSFPEIMLTGGADCADSRWVSRVCDLYDLGSIQLSEGAAVAVLQRRDPDGDAGPKESIEWLGGALYNWHRQGVAGSNPHVDWFRDTLDQALQSTGHHENEIVGAGYSCTPGSALAEPLREVLAAKWGSGLLHETSAEDAYAFAASPVKDFFDFLRAAKDLAESGSGPTGSVLFAAASEDGDCSVLIMKVGA